MKKQDFSTIYVGTHPDSTIEIPGKKVFQITFDDKEDTFNVSSADLDLKYSVPRGDLVGDFRNSGEVVSQILKDLDYNGDTMLVSIDASAREEIDHIWEANIVLFPFPGAENI